MSTLAQLRAAAVSLVESETERDPVPAAVEAFCKERAGRPLTKRDAEELERRIPGLDVSIYRDDGQHGLLDVVIRYWAKVHVDARTGEVTGNAGRWKALDGTAGRGEYVADLEAGAAAVALHALGVPAHTGAREIRVRRTRYQDPAQGAGATRWPSVVELREWNAWAYAARDERNAARSVSLAHVNNGGDLARIATLVDEINLLAAELRGHLDGGADTQNSTPSEVCRAVDSLLTVTLEKKS